MSALVPADALHLFRWLRATDAGDLLQACAEIRARYEPGNLPRILQKAIWRALNIVLWVRYSWRVNQATNDIDYETPDEERKEEQQAALLDLIEHFEIYPVYDEELVIAQRICEGSCQRPETISRIRAMMEKVQLNIDAVNGELPIPAE